MCGVRTDVAYPCVCSSLLCSFGIVSFPFPAWWISKERRSCTEPLREYGDVEKCMIGGKVAVFSSKKLHSSGKLCSQIFRVVSQKYYAHLRNCIHSIFSPHCFHPKNVATQCDSCRNAKVLRASAFTLGHRSPTQFLEGCCSNPN